MIEKYHRSARSHPEKAKRLEQLLAPKEVQLIRTLQPSRPPDLLLYEPDLSAYSFAEVKRVSEPPTAGQRAAFAKLRTATGARIELIIVRET